MLKQIQVTYFDRDEKPTNKIRKIDVIDGDNAKMANEVVYESVYNNTSQSKLRI